MELRTAESKSLIRRKTVKVNTGAGSSSRQSPTLQAQLFLRSFSTFTNVFVPVFAFFFFFYERYTVATKISLHKQSLYLILSLST